jgi:transcriptional regulator with XRE-family HTH domain
MDADLTQQEVAERVGLTRTSITNIERGAQHIALHQLYLLAAAVGLEPEQLLPEHDGTIEELLPERALRALGEDREGLDFAARVLRNSPTPAGRRAARAR